jgi:2-hydroxychromene-2-carboxylate isomerase
VADSIRFYFDPRCPWCYQTSRWVRQLQDLGEVEVSWGVFSLDIANSEDDPASLGEQAPGALALRTVIALRDAEGDPAVGRFYEALGEAIHQRGEDGSDRAVVGRALETIGVPDALIDKAVGDATTWDRVVAEHTALVERTRSFGVPTIVLDGGDGPAIFGPVISEVPTDADAVQLWKSVSWLTRYENFSELKRDRTIDPDLESIRRYKARRA